MIGALLLYGVAALLVVHVALDLRNVRHALHRMRARKSIVRFCDRCHSDEEPPGHSAPARDLWWTVITLVVLLAHLAADLIGGIP